MNITCIINQLSIKIIKYNYSYNIKVTVLTLKLLTPHQTLCKLSN